jgi:hypothetical protein
MLRISELNAKVERLTPIKSSYSFGSNLEVKLEHKRVKNLVNPFGFFTFSPLTLILLLKNIYSSSDFKSNKCIVPVSEVVINLSFSKLKLRQKI